jgi:hypothetical protein
MVLRLSPGQRAFMAYFIRPTPLKILVVGFYLVLASTVLALQLMSWSSVGRELCEHTTQIAEPFATNATIAAMLRSGDADVRTITAMHQETENRLLHLDHSLFQERIAPLDRPMYYATTYAFYAQQFRIPGIPLACEATTTGQYTNVPCVSAMGEMNNQCIQNVSATIHEDVLSGSFPGSSPLRLPSTIAAIILFAALLHVVISATAYALFIMPRKDQPRKRWSVALIAVPLIMTVAGFVLSLEVLLLVGIVILYLSCVFVLLMQVRRFVLRTFLTYLAAFVTLASVVVIPIVLHPYTATEPVSVALRDQVESQSIKPVAHDFIIVHCVSAVAMTEQEKRDAGLSSQKSMQRCDPKCDSICTETCYQKDWALPINGKAPSCVCACRALE